MTDETLQGDHGFQSAWRGGEIPSNSEIAIVRTSAADTKIGMVVTHDSETYPDIAPAITTDLSWIGVVNNVQNLVTVLADDPDWDLDDVIPDNMEIEIYKRGCGAIMAMILENKAGPVAVVKGDLIAIGTEAGKVRKWLYVDSAEATDSMREVIGTAYEASAGDTTDDKILLVRLDK